MSRTFKKLRGKLYQVRTFSDRFLNALLQYIEISYFFRTRNGYIWLFFWRSYQQSWSRISGIKKKRFFPLNLASPNFMVKLHTTVCSKYFPAYFFSNSRFRCTQTIFYCPSRRNTLYQMVIPPKLKELEGRGLTLKRLFRIIKTYSTSKGTSFIGY